ncbi:class I SAM-dependent methyltransferase [Brachybacterium sacelli]|uniref:SAM-dependent methyltransferase n=1 Tax=Brachybacterium sacelli TaxID=173364 RepID=A0ABS4X5W4_9MICO|nr:class I SAM-dependent methyltransferase [Brachybacterium sacelli]MBP2383633.1 SAM-dependent methyltransferase [Brachybacterium sacelli]
MPEQSDAEVVRQNSKYWELLAPHRRGEPVDFFREGGSALTEAELAAIGDVQGRRVLQLAGSIGDEGLTFAQRGADVTVVDIAPSHLETGRAKASALGLSVDFIEQDMMSLDPDITGFDIVYISSGGICWAPNLSDWAALVADRLNDGGLLVVQEHHPLWEVLTVRGLGELSVTGDYFNAGWDGYDDQSKAPQVTRVLGVPDAPHRSYVWSVGSLTSALVTAGFTIRSLQEFPELDMYSGLGERASSIPATYLLAATR